MSFILPLTALGLQCTQRRPSSDGNMGLDYLGDNILAWTTNLSFKENLNPHVVLVTLS